MSYCKHAVCWCIKLFKLSSASDAACVFETAENAICVCGIPDRENLETRNLELTLGDNRSRENIWRETLFLCLVQIESKAHRLISICTKHRKSFCRQNFSRDKPSGIDNSPRTQKKSYGTSTQVCTQANACTIVVQADLEAVACNHCSTKLNACCRLFTLETGPQSPVYGVHSTASVPQL